jgi:hypothetical protein
LLHLTNGNLLGGGKPVLTGPTIFDKTNIDQIAKFASRAPADAAVPSQVEQILPGTDEPYGSLFPVDEEGARRTSCLVVAEQAARHRGYGARAPTRPVPVDR